MVGNRYPLRSLRLMLIGLASLVRASRVGKGEMSTDTQQESPTRSNLCRAELKERGSVEGRHRRKYRRLDKVEVVERAVLGHVADLAPDLIVVFGAAPEIPGLRTCLTT